MTLLQRPCFAAAFFSVLLWPLVLAAQTDAEKFDLQGSQREMKKLEDKWTELRQKLQKAESVEHDTNAARDAMKWAQSTVDTVPEVFAAEKKQMTERIKAIGTELEALSKTAAGQEAATRQREYWDRDTAEFKGWESEKPATFAGMLSVQNEANSKLGMPKTAKEGEMARRQLKKLQDVPDSPPVAAFRTELTKLDNDTRQRLIATAEAVLKEASATKLTQRSRDRLESFRNDDLRLVLDGVPQQAALQKRAADLVAAFDQKAGAATAATSAAHDALQKNAAALWPQLAAKIKTVDLDAAGTLAGQQKGAVIHLNSTPNRMGWDFKTGSYDFASWQNGNPIVGKFSAPVRKAVDEALKSAGLQELPEENCDVIARVSGTAKAVKFENVEGDLKIKGTSDSLKITGRKEVTVDAVLLDIIGFHCGPIAVVAGEGAVTADGTLAPAGSAGATASSGGFMVLLYRLVITFMGLVLAGLCLYTVKSPLVAKVPAIEKLGVALGAGGIRGLGLLAILLALWWMLRGFFIYGFLLWASFLAAGVFLAAEFLVEKKVLPAPAALMIKEFGFLIALAVGAVSVLHLLLGGTLFFL